MKNLTKNLLVPVSILASTPALAHNISPEDILRMNEGGTFDYIHLGATHMLTGYDHLLFLFGVMFFLTKFNDIVTKGDWHLLKDLKSRPRSKR